MDKKAVIKLLAGTILRGLLWGSAAIGSWLGTEAMDESTATGLAVYIASAVVAIIATLWSKKKDTKLTFADPKGFGPENQMLRKYSRFLHSCAESGEEPKSYEWFRSREKKLAESDPKARL